MLNDATKLLPIGSVVLLKNGTKEIMITGFYTVTEQEPDKIWDYCACLYPEGLVNSNQNLLFNHDQIDKILYVGYISDKDKNFKLKMAEGIKNLSLCLIILHHNLYKYNQQILKILVFNMKNVVFDLGSVILRNKAVSVLNNLDLTEDEYSKLALFFSNFERLDVSELSIEDKIKECNIDSKLLDKYGDYLYNYFKYRKLNFNLLTLIKKLKINGYKVYVLSDNNKYAYNYYKNHPLFQDFDGWIVSCEYKTIKKDGKLFNYLLEKYNLKSDESFFIDDNIDNIEVAKKKGFKTHLFNEEEDIDLLYDDLKNHGVNIDISDYYNKINTPLELLEFMSNNIFYGYLGKSGRIYNYLDEDMDNNWYSEYILESKDDILNTLIGNCFDQVELERDWFTRNNYEIKTYFEMVDTNLENNYPTHSFLVYKDNNKYYWFENSDFNNRGIHEYNTLEELLIDQKKKYIDFVGIENIIINEYQKPISGIDANEYLHFCTKC